MHSPLALSCVDDSVEPQTCHEGTVVGKIRTVGGGLAVSMEDATFSNYKGRGFKNVIEAVNISHDLYKPGDKIYFTARRATKEEQVFAISADGDESEKPIVFVEWVSTTMCSLITN